MGNYSGSSEEQLEKRRAYDKARQSTPEYREAQRLRRNIPEAKARQKIAAKRYTSTPEFKAKKAERRARQDYKDKRRDTIFRQTYGITLADYEVMFKQQNGVCFICEHIDPVRSLAVDHDHITGRVRGLLCRDCNQGLGKFKDNIDLFRKAIEYLNVI